MFRLSVLYIVSLICYLTCASETGAEFRKAKYSYVFNQFFDLDRNGFVGTTDIHNLISAVQNVFNLKPGDIEYQKINDWSKIFGDMAKEHDKNQDGLISMQEWIETWNAYAIKPEDARPWQNLYEQTVFDTIDANKNNKIEQEEFVNIYSAFGASREDVITAFNKFSNNDIVTRDRYHELWKQLFSSEDVNAPGNFILGTLKF